MTNKFAVLNRISGVTYPILRADESAKWPAPSEGWNGDIAAIYIRNSRHVQRGNNRSKWQLDLASYLMGSGYAVKIYDEQGVSGARLSERDVATQMVVDLRAGIVTCIAVAELSRLTRDDRAFDAEYLADVLIEYGQGKLITYEKVFDLRKAEDRREYDLLVAAAAQHRNELARTLASGLVRGFQDGPIFRGPCRLGYRRVQRFDSLGHIEVDRYGKVRRALEKDPTAASVMQELARQFDTQPDLTRVCKAMHEGNWNASWKPITGGYVWRSDRLRSLLSAPLYEGLWRYMPNESSSSVWLQPSPQIPCDVSASEIVHRLPHLAWFSPSQMARWREKFLGRPPRFTRGNHRHRLAGIIACAYCHETLSRNGKNGYRCAKYGRGCDAGLFVTERLAGEAVDRLLPEAISGSDALAAAIRSYLSAVEPKALEGRIEELADRLSFLAEHPIHRPEMAMWIHLEEQGLMRRKSKLEAELSVRRVDAELAVSLIRCAADFERDPSGEVAQLNPSAKAFLARALFERIELVGAGHGNGRVIRVASLVPRQSGVAISSRLHYP